MKMKKGFFVLGLLTFSSLAIWAYQTSGKTRIALGELQSLESDISKERETIEILKAEWAILNRPERLRFLVNQNFNLLQLQKIDVTNYGETQDVPYQSLDIHSSDYVDPSDIDIILQDLKATGALDNP